MEIALQDPTGPLVALSSLDLNLGAFNCRLHEIVRT